MADESLDPPRPAPRAMVTGASGFLGRALVHRLTSRGVAVLAVDRSPSAAVPSGAATRQADLLDLSPLGALVREFAGSAGGGEVIVYHLAGLGHVGQCQRDPDLARAMNVTATANLADACRRSGVRRVVFPSTALVYGPHPPCPVDEAQLAAPATVYAETKLAAEGVLARFAADYGFSCVVARLANVYGFGANEDSIASIVLRQVRGGQSPAVRTLAPVRDFIYRDDVVEGLIRLAGALPRPGLWVANLGSGRPASIRDLALAACRAARLPPVVSESEPPAVAVPPLVLSIGRLQEWTGWRPEVSLEQGLARALGELILRGK